MFPRAPYRVSESQFSVVALLSWEQILNVTIHAGKPCHETSLVSPCSGDAGSDELAFSFAMLLTPLRIPFQTALVFVGGNYAKCSFSPLWFNPTGSFDRHRNDRRDDFVAAASRSEFGQRDRLGARCLDSNSWAFGGQDENDSESNCSDVI